ncbi:MAG: endonuclease/exonuclease/phosphatase family protein [Ignavibacteriales bacterium]|nr:endonuclease/exonuclease/phosphatase family protein [Ignavibacteriales bacterium]
MSWNLLNYTVSETERNNYYKTVIGSVAPDIFVCQEVADGQAAVDSFYKNVIQQILPTHAKGLFVNGTDTDNAIFFNPALFTFVSNTPIRTALRDITEFKLVKTSSGDTLRIYSVHLKASSGADNELLRAKEVDSLRKVTNLLTAGSNFFVCGDFNLYNSNEAAYQKLILDNPGDEGDFIDPIIMPISSNWNNASNAAYHTQSPRVRQFGGGSTGGMDDRFDLMLFSNAIVQTGGMYYVPNSFVAYGNDGNHYNDSINSLPNSAVSAEIANAIHYAADHLPIYAKFTFPASVTAPTAQATNLQFSSITTTSFTGNFTAASPAADGYLVLRKAGSAPASLPANGNAYTVGSALGDAVVAYSGSGTTFANTGLSSGVTYYFKIFSFNGSGSSSTYLTTNPLSGAQATNSASPALTISTGSLTFSNTEVSTSSAVQSFTVSGSNLSANIIIAPPVDFQVSTNSGSGFVSNPSTIVLTPISGAVASTTIYARFSPLTASGSRSDSILISSTGATSGNVQVSGVSISSSPSVQSSISIGNETAGSVTANYSGGNGTKRILIIRQGSAVDL